MHSFAFALIFAVLAILTSAAPIASPENHPGSASLVTRTGSSSSFASQFESVARSIERSSDSSETIDSVRARDNTPSISAIYATLLQGIKPYVWQSNITNVSDVVHSLHALITQADCDIDVLDNQPASVILVSADGSTQLSGSQLATTVANFMSSIYRVAANAIDTDPVVLAKLDDLFDDVDDLVDDTIDLMHDTIYGQSDSDLWDRSTSS